MKFILFVKIVCVTDMTVIKNILLFIFHCSLFVVLFFIRTEDHLSVWCTKTNTEEYCTFKQAHFNTFKILFCTILIFEFCNNLFIFSKLDITLKQIDHFSAIALFHIFLYEVKIINTNLFNLNSKLNPSKRNVIYCVPLRIFVKIQKCYLFIRNKFILK